MVHIQTSQYNFNFGFMSLQGTHKVHIQIANMILNVADISKYSPISTISESEYIFSFTALALSPAWSVREEEVVLVGVR